MVAFVTTAILASAVMVTLYDLLISQKASPGISKISV